MSAASMSRQTQPILGYISKTYEKKNKNCFNPLLHTCHYSVRMTKISILKSDHQKNSYERRVYESADDSSLS